MHKEGQGWTTETHAEQNSHACFSSPAFHNQILPLFCSSRQPRNASIYIINTIHINLRSFCICSCKRVSTQAFPALRPCSRNHFFQLSVVRCESKSRGFSVVSSRPCVGNWETRKQVTKAKKSRQTPSFFSQIPSENEMKVFFFCRPRRLIIMLLT